MKYAWLSHIIDTETPLYGGQKGGIRIEPDKSIAAGDACNTSQMTMPVHAGTHVDAPRHFIDAGSAIDVIPADRWVFRHPVVANIDVSPGQLIQPDDIKVQLPDNTDVCLFRTGFEKFRQTDTYWKMGPGIAPETAEFLHARCPNMKAIGRVKI